MDKHKRYRHKMLDNGHCPHCGRYCAPYTECAERREYKRKKRRKENGYKHGWDARNTPRVNNKPIIYETDFVEMMLEEGLQVSPAMFDIDGAR